VLSVEFGKVVNNAPASLSSPPPLYSHFYQVYTPGFFALASRARGYPSIVFTAQSSCIVVTPPSVKLCLRKIPYVDRVLLLLEHWLWLEWWILSCSFEAAEPRFGAVYTHKISTRSDAM